MEAFPELDAIANAALIFRSLRAARTLETVVGGPAALPAFLAEHADGLKPEVLWELHASMGSSFNRQLAQAEHARQRLERSFVELLAEHDVLVCPCTLMPPFDASIRYPATLAPTLPNESQSALDDAVNEVVDEAPDARQSVHFGDYIDWMLPCSLVSLTGLPAVSVPIGTTADGCLPIGVQLVGQPGGEARLLLAAALLERAVNNTVNDAARVPLDPRRAVPPMDHSHGWRGPLTVEAAAAHLANAPPLT